MGRYSNPEIVTAVCRGRGAAGSARHRHARQAELTEFLEALLRVDVDATEARRLAGRQRFANIPTLWRIDDFDFAAQPSVDGEGSVGYGRRDVPGAPGAENQPREVIMNRGQMIGTAGVVGLLVLGIGNGTAAAQASEKVVVNHKGRCIVIGEAAMPAHLAHGDHLKCAATK